jgi:hypothetical protein
MTCGMEKLGPSGPRSVTQTQYDLYKAQLRWEPWKALAAMIAAAAVFVGGVVALSNWVRPSVPQTINVHLDAPLIVQPQR